MVIYHDILEQDVWISEDEGKEWKLAEGVPKGQAIMVQMHPFSPRTVRTILIRMISLLLTLIRLLS